MPNKARYEIEKAARHFRKLNSSRAQRNKTAKEPFANNNDLRANLPNFYLYRGLTYDDQGNPLSPLNWGKNFTWLRNKQQADENCQKIANLCPHGWWGKSYNISKIVRIAKQNGMEISEKTVRRYFKRCVS